MKLYIRSIRDGETGYSITEGMTEETVRQLMEEIGHSDIEFIFESDYNLRLI